MNKFNIVITGALHPCALELLKKYPQISCDYLPDIPREKLLASIDKYHAIISRSETIIDKTLIDKGRLLKVIARAAVGFGNIDIDHASSKGILVFNTPGINTNAAAELTLGLMLCASRKMIAAHAHMDNKRWERHRFTGTELRGKTVGLIGLGNVGNRVAQFLHAMGCTLLAFDPFVTEEYCAKHHCAQVSLKDILERADILSVHTPKNAGTVNLLDFEQFDRMKDGVIVINAARGGIINEEALVKGLDSGKVATAGIDTWDTEPPSPDNPLTNHPRVVMTPHIGASTFEAQKAIAESVVRETVRGLEGGIVNNPLNLPNISKIGNDTIGKYSSLAEKLGLIAAHYIDDDFHPLNIEFLFRGTLEKKDSGLIKLSFLKSFLSVFSNHSVSYVNALAISKSKGFDISESNDRNFSDYESAIRVNIVSKKNDSFVIGGVLLGKDKTRLSYFQGLSFEVEPVGNIVIIENNDFPGVIGHIGVTMEKHGININQLYLSRYKQGDKAITIMQIDNPLTDEAKNDLTSFPNIKKISGITLD